jgi:hypothetical protein
MVEKLTFRKVYLYELAEAGIAVPVLLMSRGRQTYTRPCSHTSTPNISFNFRRFTGWEEGFIPAPFSQTSTSISVCIFARKIQKAGVEGTMTLVDMVHRDTSFDRTLAIVN